jgi:hypothetical protein
MITSIAQLLQELMAKEVQSFKSYQTPCGNKIKHGPTIGEMYEGLTEDILNRTIPPSLNLRLVKGFIDSGNGLSLEADIMLARGEGEQIPYTQRYAWHIKDVIAVFEVKKNLYAKELEDALKKMNTVYDIHKSYLATIPDKVEVDANPSFKAFAILTGYYPASMEEIEELTLEHQICPIRIIWGYEGYVDEHALRSGMIKYIDDNIGKPFGAGYMALLQRFN